MGQTLANHSYVDLDLVGRTDEPLSNVNTGDSVECHTDLTTCCSGSDGVHRGDWYFPNGTRLPFAQSTGIYESRDTKIVEINRNHEASQISGIYQCNIPTKAVHDSDNASVRNRVYVGLYTSGEGMYTTSSLITYQSCSYYI